MKRTLQPTSRFVRASLAALLITSVVTVGCKRSSSSSASAQKRQARAMEDREEELQYRKENGTTDWRRRVDAAKEAMEEAQSDSRWGQKQSALERALDAARLMPPPGKDFDLPEIVPNVPVPTSESESTTGESSGDSPDAPSSPDASSPDASSPDASSHGDTKPSQSAGKGENESETSSGAGESPAVKENNEDKGGGRPASGEGQNANEKTGSELESGNGKDESTTTSEDPLFADAAAEEQAKANRVTNEEVRALREQLNELLSSLEGSVGRSSSSLSLERDIIEIE